MDPKAGSQGASGMAPEHQDFVNRYQQGVHAVSGEEAATHYQNVAPQLSPDDYKQSAYDAFSRMSPEERKQFAQYVGVQAQQQGYPFPDVNHNGVDDRYEDPQHLANTTAQMNQARPGLLGQLFGGGGPGPGIGAGGAGSLLQSPWAKGALAGIAAYGLGRMFMGGGYGGGFFGGDNDGGFFGGGDQGGFGGDDGGGGGDG